MVNAKPRHWHYAIFRCSMCRKRWLLDSHKFPSVLDVVLARAKLQEYIDLMASAHAMLPAICQDCREGDCV